jgi:hypothetical protein
MAKTIVWFSDNGKRICAEIACQDGKQRVLRAKDEEGKEIETSFIEEKAIASAKRINRYGYPDPQPQEDGSDENGWVQ